MLGLKGFRLAIARGVVQVRVDLENPLAFELPRNVAQHRYRAFETIER